MLTDYERIHLRIKCVEVFVGISSRIGLEERKPLELGEELWKFATKEEVANTPKGLAKPVKL
jgi:hypothetical protein